MQLTIGGALNLAGPSPDYAVAQLPLPALMLLATIRMARHARRRAHPATVALAAGRAGALTLKGRRVRDPPPALG